MTTTSLERTGPGLGLLLPLSIGVVTLSTQAVFLVGAAFPQVGPELGIGPVGLGLLTASFFLTASVTSAPLGGWVQRVGWQRAMRLNLRVTAVVLALVPVLVRDAITLGVLLALAAAVYGISNPAANLMLAERGDGRRQATVFGVKHAGIPGSTLLAGLAVPLLVERSGWRSAFVAAAVLAALLSLVVPPPDGQPPRSDEQTARAGTPTVDTQESTDTIGPAATTTRADLLLLAAGSAFATWGAIALGTYLVSASVAAGFTASQAGVLQFVGSAVSITGRVLAGVVTDARRGNGLAGIVVLTACGSLAFVTLSVADGPLYVVFVLVAFGTGWSWPGLMTFAVVHANRGTVARSSAITQAGVFVGAGGAPILLGAVIERWSYEGAWLAAGGGLLTATVVVSLVALRLRRRRS